MKKKRLSEPENFYFQMNSKISSIEKRKKMFQIQMHKILMKFDRHLNKIKL